MNLNGNRIYYEEINPVKMKNKQCFVDLFIFLHLFLLYLKWLGEFHYVFLSEYCFIF